MSENTFNVLSKTSPAEKFWQYRGLWVKIYIVLISTLGLLLIWHSLTNLPEDLLGFGLFIILGVITEVVGVELFANMRGSRISAGAIIAISGVLTFGPYAGVIINAVCGLSSSIMSEYSQKKTGSDKRAPFFQRALFNIGMLSASTYFAGVTYVFLVAKINDPLMFANIFAILVAVIVSESTNIFLLVGIILLQTRQSIHQIMDQNFRWGMPISILGGVVGSLAMHLAYSQFGLLGLGFFFLPVLAVGYSFRLYMNNMRVYVNRLEDANSEMDKVNTTLLETLGSVIDAYDIYTYGHSAQVAVYVAELCDRMRISGPEKLKIVRAALVHDIGKIGVTDSIIGKPGALTEDESQLMRRHPIISADILRQMSGLYDLIPLVRHHHEKWNGHGYPAGLAGEEIPLGARVIAVADTLDAMCSSRPYRSALKIDVVKQEIQRGSGVQFDPNVVEAFLKLSSEKDQSYFKDSASSIDEKMASNQLLNNPEGLRYLKRSALLKEEKKSADQGPVLGIDEQHLHFFGISLN